MNEANKITTLDAATPLLFHARRQWRGASEFFRWPFRIPTGFRLPAQGCEERATLGKRCKGTENPKGVPAAG
jgi:hypothetical protein